MTVKRTAIILAGGTGTRMKSGIPKQFLLLGGKPMLMHSIESFAGACHGHTEIVVVLPAGQFPEWQKLCHQYDFHIPHRLVEGGTTRFHSVQNALSVINNEGLVGIHDGARPLVSQLLIREAFQAAEHYGTCIPVTRLNESVRIVSGDANRAVDRSVYRVVQTPQVFSAALIKKAYQQDYQEHFSDDATVAESLGGTIHMIPGDPINMKITHPDDLPLAEALLKNR